VIPPPLVKQVCNCVLAVKMGLTCVYLYVYVVCARCSKCAGATHDGIYQLRSESFER
jgi:hypothetical protein